MTWMTFYMSQQDTMKMLIVHSNINKNHNKKYHKMNTVYLRTGCNLVLKKYILYNAHEDIG